MKARVKAEWERDAGDGGGDPAAPRRRRATAAEGEDLVEARERNDTARDTWLILPVGYACLKDISHASVSTS